MNKSNHNARKKGSICKNSSFTPYHEGAKSKVSRWVKVIDYGLLRIDKELEQTLLEDLYENRIALVAYPNLSNQDINNNTCAIVIGHMQTPDGIYCLLEPSGNKKRIFAEMINERGGIISRICGSGVVNYVTAKDAVVILNKIKYITLSFA